MRTIGRWPWKSASGKKRVITYLWNSAAPKIDGAHAVADARLQVGGRMCAVEGALKNAVEAYIEQILDIVTIICLRRQRPMRRRVSLRWTTLGREPET